MAGAKAGAEHDAAVRYSDQELEKREAAKQDAVLASAAAAIGTGMPLDQQLAPSAR